MAETSSLYDDNARIKAYVAGVIDALGVSVGVNITSLTKSENNPGGWEFIVEFSGDSAGIERVTKLLLAALKTNSTAFPGAGTWRVGEANPHQYVLRRQRDKRAGARKAPPRNLANVKLLS